MLSVWKKPLAISELNISGRNRTLFVRAKASFAEGSVLFIAELRAGRVDPIVFDAKLEE
jgi:hypothetical protein